MAVRDEIKAQTSKMKDMSPKEKWNYFWTYYKVHVIVVAAVILFLVSLIRDVTSAKETVFYVAMINAGVDSENDAIFGTWEQELGERFQIDPEKEEVFFDTTMVITNGENMELDYANAQKLMVMSASRSLDAFTANTSTFEDYAQSSLFYPLEDLLSPEAYERLSPYFYYTDAATFPKEDENLEMEAQQKREEMLLSLEINHNDPSTMKEPVAVGLFLKDSQKMQACKAYETWVKGGRQFQGYPEEGILGIAVGTKHPELAEQFIEYYFGEGQEN